LRQFRSPLVAASRPVEELPPRRAPIEPFARAFGAHSLRSGFLTSAARRGASVFKMRDVSRHKSMDVLQAYVRDADMFRDHAGAGLL
jgi:hypothetical protein